MLARHCIDLTRSTCVNASTPCSKHLPWSLRRSAGRFHPVSPGPAPSKLNWVLYSSMCCAHMRLTKSCFAVCSIEQWKRTRGALASGIEPKGLTWHLHRTVQVSLYARISNNPYGAKPRIRTHLRMESRSLGISEYAAAEVRAQLNERALLI